MVVERKQWYREQTVVVERKQGLERANSGCRENSGYREQTVVIEKKQWL